MPLSVRQAMEMAAQFMRARLGGMPKSAWVPAIILFLFSMMADADGRRSLAESLILVYVSSFIAFFWVSRFLQGPKELARHDSTFVGLDGSLINVGAALKHLLAFQWRLCLVGLIVYLAGYLVEMLAVAGLPSIGNTPPIYFVLFVGVVASPLIARVWLMMPAAAIGYPNAGLVDAWKLSRGAGAALMRLVVALLVATIIVALLADGVALILSNLTRGSAAAYVAAHFIEALMDYCLVAFWGCVMGIAFYGRCPNIGEFAVIRHMGGKSAHRPSKPAPTH